MAISGHFLTPRCSTTSSPRRVGKKELTLRSTFYEAAIITVTDMLEHSTADCRAQMMQLRGLFKIWDGKLMDALDDFSAIWKIDPTSFPNKLVTEIVRAQTLGVRQNIRQKGREWREFSNICDEEADGLPVTPMRRRRSFSQDGDLIGSVVLPEIGGHSQVLAAVRDGEYIDEKSFIAICKILDITENDAPAANLFSSLCAAEVDEESDDKISVDAFIRFVETWDGAQTKAHIRTAHPCSKMVPMKSLI